MLFWVRYRWFNFWWWNLLSSIHAHLLISLWNVGWLLLYVERPSHWYAQIPFLRFLFLSWALFMMNSLKMMKIISRPCVWSLETFFQRLHVFFQYSLLIGPCKWPCTRLIGLPWHVINETTVFHCSERATFELHFCSIPSSSIYSNASYYFFSLHSFICYASYIFF